MVHKDKNKLEIILANLMKTPHTSFSGLDCGEMDKEALQCLPDCSGHGQFDLETQSCICQPLWSGSDCSSGKFNSTYPSPPIKPTLFLNPSSYKLCGVDSLTVNSLTNDQPNQLALA